MIEQQLPQNVLQLLQDRYGDLENPNYAFVANEFKREPYLPIKQTLEDIGADVIDTTDLNYDIAVFISATKDNQKIGLALSLVGPYAMLNSYDANGKRIFITSLDAEAPELLRVAYEAIRGMGLELLDQQAADIPVSMNLIESEPDEIPTLYQALFNTSSPLID